MQNVANQPLRLKLPRCQKSTGSGRSSIKINPTTSAMPMTQAPTLLIWWIKR